MVRAVEWGANVIWWLSHMVNFGQVPPWEAKSDMHDVYLPCVFYQFKPFEVRIC